MAKVNKNVDWTKVKVGDKVLIRKDLEAKKMYSHHDNRLCDVVPDMVELAGKEVKITDISKHRGLFHVDNFNYYWSSDMFVGVVTEKSKPETTSIDDFAALMLFVSKVIHADPYTIIFYKGLDGKERRAKVKCQNGDVYDKAKGVEIATLKAIKREIERKLREF